jgi:hypothetical protein
MSQSDADELAEELGRIGYRGLFVAPGRQQRLDELWNAPDAPDRLYRLATDAARPWQTRFLASEAVFNKQMFLQQPEHFASLAPVYAKALTENATGFMSDWGFRHDMNDSGQLGSRFILFGRDSEAVLRPLLDDSREVAYFYPPEFPSEMRLGLRIQDFAALYLGKIYGIPLRLTEDAAQRDGEIRRLRQLLP